MKSSAHNCVCMCMLCHTHHTDKHTYTHTNTHTNTHTHTHTSPHNSLQILATYVHYISRNSTHDPFPYPLNIRLLPDRRMSSFLSSLLPSACLCLVTNGHLFPYPLNIWPLPDRRMSSFLSSLLPSACLCLGTNGHLCILKLSIPP